MTTNEEQELRNAARYLRRRIEVGGYEFPHRGVVNVNGVEWASMLERAADRIQELEAHLESWLRRMAKPFDYYIDKSGECWLWTGTVAPNGYGRVSYKGVYRGAHRVAYERAFGEIPAGLQIHHKCHVPNCVNPAHLQALTYAQHWPRHESIPAINSRKTHCMRGHKFDDLNTYRDGKGYRQCRQCKRLHYEANHHRYQPRDPIAKREYDKRRRAELRRRRESEVA